MNQFHFPISLGWAVLISAELGLSSCEKPEAAKPPVPVVEASVVKTRTVSQETTLIGQLDSPQNVEVRARVEGFVDKMPFTEGTEIKQGDVLFLLDQKPFQERLAAAKGALAESNAALNKYEKDVDRLAPLAEKRAIPRQDLDNAQAAVEVGKAAVVSAQARVQSAELDLGYCEIKAPTSGLIGAKQVSIGELVGKGQPTLLATISVLNPIWFYCNIGEVQYLHAQARSRETGKDMADLPVRLILSDGSEHPEKGRFVFIDRAVDAKTGTLRVRAEFPNSKKLLRPGMFARIQIELGDRPNCITVPTRSIVELQGKTFVWIVTPENKASQRAVKTGEQIGADFIIEEGLKPGEKVIIEGIHKVREGGEVSVKDEV